MRLSSAASVAGLLLLSSVGAEASTCQWPDRPVVYAASSCKRPDVQANDTVFDIDAYGTAIHNSDTGSHRDLICPIVRFDPAEGTGGINQIVLNVGGTSGWSATSCHFYATTWDGSTTYTAPTPTITYFTTTSQFIWAPYAVPDYANYVVRCSVPPSQWVYKLEVSECGGGVH